MDSIKELWKSCHNLENSRKAGWYKNKVKKLATLIRFRHVKQEIKRKLLKWLLLLVFGLQGCSNFPFNRPGTTRLLLHHRTLKYVNIYSIWYKTGIEDLNVTWYWLPGTHFRWWIQKITGFPVLVCYSVTINGSTCIKYSF